MASAFPKVAKIEYEGPKSKNPLAFKHYNAAEVVEGKTMREHLRFSVVYWHTMRGRGADMFGAPTVCATTLCTRPDSRSRHRMPNGPWTITKHSLKRWK